MLSIFATGFTQEEHKKEHQQQHQHQHQHHRHHNNAQRQQFNLINPKNTYSNNNNNNKTFGGHAWLSQPDHAENELEKRAKGGWSAWSSWSMCSRSCDGGIAQQLRRCLAAKGCRGEPIRYRICNMQVKYP